MKKLINKTQKVVRGMPTAVVVSILIHAGLFFGATVLVIFKFRPPPPIQFEPPPPVKVPKMPLKKLNVKMKKPTKPKSSAKITAVVPKLDLHEIQFPDLASSGIGAGLSGGGEVVDFGPMPIFDEAPGSFGEPVDIGNNLVGTFYDFKRRRAGGPLVLDRESFKTAVGKFTRGGWHPSDLARFYRAPKKLYATSIMIGAMHSALAPGEFGEETEGLQWIVHYKGKLVYPKPIKFRFWGCADDIMLVRVGEKDVLNGSWPGSEPYYSDWGSSAPGSRSQRMGNTWAVGSDWITLEAHKPVEMQVLIGEEPGGHFSAMLAVEVEGEDYEINKFGGRIFPMFKTAEPSFDLLDAIYYNLFPGEATPIGGPVFCDYGETGTDEKTAGKSTPGDENLVEDKVAAKEDPVDETGIRTWTSTRGETFEGEYVMVMGGKVVLRDAKGKNQKIPLDLFSEEDRRFMELDKPPKFKIEFSRASKQYQWSSKRPMFYSMDKLPGVIDYVFTTKIKQESSGSYPHELHVESFAIGEEIDGDNYILLDRRESTFVPDEQTRGEYHTFGGRSVRLYDYEFETDGRRGQRYGGYLVVVTDSRGKIIEHKSSYNWLFEKRGELSKLGLMNHFDKTCTRVHPPRPKTGRNL